MTDGYARPTSVTFTTRADMQESIAGYDDAALEREWVFALGMTDYNDTDQLRWLVSLAVRRIEDIEGGRPSPRVRYLASFSPQAWQNDQVIAVDPEGETEWDATSFIVSALADEWHDWAEATIARGKDYDDILWQDPNAPEWVRGWAGPFDTYLRETT